MDAHTQIVNRNYHQTRNNICFSPKKNRIRINYTAYCFYIIYLIQKIETQRFQMCFVAFMLSLILAIRKTGTENSLRYRTVGEPLQTSGGKEGNKRKNVQKNNNAKR